MTRLARIALGAYPPSFRERYGPELAALVEDLPASLKTSTDLFLGAARAWIQPPLPSAQRRLQATVATTWVGWCAGFLVAPAINRALLDPPMAGASSSVRALLNVAYVLFFVGWAFVLLGAVPVVHRAVIPALRARSWTALRPLLPALVLGVVEAIGLLWIAMTAGGRTGQLTHPSTLLAIGTVSWLIGFAAFICSLGFGPVMALRRLEPGVRTLRLSTGLAVPVALTLAALTGCSLAATLIAGDASLVSSAVPVGLALAVGCVASVTALISSSRGILALRGRAD